jgi:hypothetical protein
VYPALTSGASAAAISSTLASGIGVLKVMACDRGQVCAECHCVASEGSRAQLDA